jgi:hypothetical protein
MVWWSRYHDVLAGTPLFRLLGKEIMVVLCQAVVPVSIVHEQVCASSLGCVDMYGCGWRSWDRKNVES